MKNITCGQKEQLSVLFRRGQLSGLPVRNPAKLSEAAAARLIAAAAQVPFGTYRLVSERMRRRLLKLRESKRVRFEDCELEFMTEDIAMGLFWVAGRREDRNTAPALRMLHQRVRKMVAKGFLEYIPNWEICLLDAEEADRLIAEGERKVAALLEK